MAITYAIQIKESEQKRAQKFLDFVQSLDFVESVTAFSEEDAVVDALIPIPVEGYLTTEEIKKLYPDQWVLTAHTRKNGVQILGGKVLLHEADKRNLALKGKDLIRQYPDVNHFYTGEFSSHAHIGLLKKTTP